MIAYRNKEIALLDLIGVYKFFILFFMSSYIMPLTPNGGLAIILSNFLFTGYLILSPYSSESNIWPVYNNKLAFDN